MRRRRTTSSNCTASTLRVHALATLESVGAAVGLDARAAFGRTIGIQLLVLTAEAHACLGVDAETGAFVRARYPDGRFAALAPLDVAAADIVVEDREPPDAARPELIDLADAPVRLGRLPVRRAARFLRPLLHPRRRPLLDFVGPAVPFWTLNGDRPSVAIVEPERAPRLVRAATGYECRFGWDGRGYALPFADLRLSAALDRRRTTDVTRLLGFPPRRLLVALTPPAQGYCYKVVAGLLP
jgi:hypothetical protein